MYRKFETMNMPLTEHYGCRKWRAYLRDKLKIGGCFSCKHHYLLVELTEPHRPFLVDL